jgi:hypothetical protein
MMPGDSLKCERVADVVVLLQASDFVAHDLDHAYANISTLPSLLLLLLLAMLVLFFFFLSLFAL